MKQLITALIAAGTISLCACGNSDQEHSSNDTTASTPATPALNVPAFNADAAYNDIATQVAFGPRTPGSAAQQKCADWMQQQLQPLCDTVYRQETTVKGGDGKQLPCINIIGSINKQATRRVLLLAHWDSRPWADQDVTNKEQPILAADDGGSGVAVLIELARQLKTKPLAKDLGVDILFTDVEDYGKTEWGEDSYCLGTQYWAKHPHVAGYKAAFGVLLDMVGGRNAQFPLEGLSTQYAGPYQQSIWQAANRAGYSSYFPFVAGGQITDDHKYVNELTHIPTVDIISLPSGSATGFPEHWHTHKDDMSVIDKGTLKAVGQTLLQTLYETAQPAS